MRCVRNFWVEVSIDGQRTRLRGGPRAREGGVSLQVFQRDEGAARLALEVYCQAAGDGLLRLAVLPRLAGMSALTGEGLWIETRR